MALKVRSVGRIIVFILLVVMALIGTFCVDGYGGDDRDEFVYRQKLAVPQSQLVGLSALLRDYRNKHGRYPTSDEGLAVLDNFSSRFSLEKAGEMNDENEDVTKANEVLGVDRSVFAFGAFLESRKRNIELFKKEYGRLPASVKDLRDEWLLRDAYPKEFNSASSALFAQLEMAFDDNNEMYILSPAGVLTPWLTPYVYENRNGLDQSVFEKSPANRDERRLYSVNVDEGIYVYAVAGEQVVRKLDILRWERLMPRYVGGGILLAAIILTVILFRRSRRKLLGGFATLLVFAAGGLGASRISYVTCYLMGPLAFKRNPQMVAQQRELLDSYHQRGVIGDQAYARAVSALEALPADHKSPQTQGIRQ